jgi:myo-inositol-1(or 4)-monophosphatase
MNSLDLSVLLETACLAARAAGNHALAHKDRRRECAENFAHDLKLVLDAECQDIAEKTIFSRHPTHGILGEEAVTPADPEEYEWIIDPIDGTMNYTHDFPYWCASVAVRKNHQVLAGCVFAPEFDACYTATIEAPARLNDQPIAPSEIANPKDALVFTGISKHMQTATDSHFQMFSRLALSTQKLRINGSAALDLCQVAAGVADGFYETSLYLWDHAAASLIARQAGVQVQIIPLSTERHACTILAANPRLFSALQSVCSLDEG